MQENPLTWENLQRFPFFAILPFYIMYRFDKWYSKRHPQPKDEFDEIGQHLLYYP